jgi:hypothetical protein
MVRRLQHLRLELRAMVLHEVWLRFSVEVTRQEEPKVAVRQAQDHRVAVDRVRCREALEHLRPRRIWIEVDLDILRWVAEEAQPRLAVDGRHERAEHLCIQGKGRRFMLRLDEPTRERLEGLSRHFKKPITAIIRQLVVQATPEAFPTSWHPEVNDRAPQQVRPGDADISRRDSP